jgi:hypothetical protein
MPWEAPGHPLLTTLQRQAAKALASLQQAIMRREQELAELQAEAARWKSVMREQSGVSRPAAPTAHPRAARASRLDWRAVLQELPTTFSARDVAQKTQKPLVTVQGVWLNLRGSQGQKNPEKAGFFAMPSSSMCSGVLKFNKKFSLPIRKG